MGTGLVSVALCPWEGESGSGGTNKREESSHAQNGRAELDDAMHLAPPPPNPSKLFLAGEGCPLAKAKLAFPAGQLNP